MKRLIKLIISMLCSLAIIAIGFHMSISNPDMTEFRMLLTYPWRFVGCLVLAVMVIVLQYEKKQ